MTMEQDHWQGPLFIVGLPRSGTKLLRTLLNHHPAIQLPVIETAFLPVWMAEWQGYGNLSDYGRFQGFYKRTLRLAYFQYQKDRGHLIECRHWYEHCEDFSIAGVFEALIRHDADADATANPAANPAAGARLQVRENPQSPQHLGSNWRIWGDKTPSYVRHMSRLAAIYPQARFIHIIRDVRDYCLSIENAWGKNKPRAAQRWVDSIRAARQSGEALGERYREIRYEALLTDPAGTIRSLCEFLGVDYHPSMLVLSKPAEALGAASGQAAIVAGNHGKYRMAMTARDLRAIEAIAGPLLHDLGYTVDTPVPAKRLSPLRMRVLQLLDGFNFLLAAMRQHRPQLALSIWFGAVTGLFRLRR